MHYRGTALSAAFMLLVGCADDGTLADEGALALQQAMEPTAEAAAPAEPAEPAVEPASGPEPKIPPVTGTCPTFRSGQATIMGLNVQMWVGPKKAEGGGSLVFYWHGTGSTSAEPERTMPRSVIDDIMAKGGILISPQNTTGRGQDSTNILKVFHEGDFEFTDIVTACAVRDHNIDPRRIYTTGCSAGGLQAGFMAYRRSSYVAAAVPNSGGMVVANPEFQDTAHIPAVMSMHGGPQDQVIVQFSQTSDVLNQGIVRAGGFVLNCNHGGGHCRVPPALYEAGWRFMQDHPFGVTPRPYAEGAPSSFPSYCEVVKPGAGPAPQAPQPGAARPAAGGARAGGLFGR